MARSSALSGHGGGLVPANAGLQRAMSRAARAVRERVMDASCLELPSDELQIVGCQIRSTLKDGDDAPIAKSFVCAIFVEVKAALLLVIKEVEILLGKLPLDLFLALARGKGGRAIDAEAVSIDFQGVV